MAKSDKRTKAQQKRLCDAIISKSQLLFLNDTITINTYMKISDVIRQARKKL